MLAWFKSTPLKQLEAQRDRIATQVYPEPLQSLVSTPLADTLTDARLLDVIVLDFETNGLNPQVHNVLSMGWVEITNGIINLGSARHYLIRSETAITGDSAMIHHLLPEQLNKAGLDEHRAFSHLLAAMAGKVVIAHGCVVEKGFLEHYVHQHYHISSLPIVWLDTLKIEQYRGQIRSTKPDWRLASIRKAYRLPDYPAHHALMDAIATAELYLAQLHGLFGSSPAKLEVLMKASQR
ncbi:exonuclease domain-containing protein [Photobacterium sanguinicancri]|uniref:Exonuclease domain-containing protein n=3 Tax=Photobacterium sanguinicancri TaxID=875932 RepID=A0AAW7Y882_9GAMM|nr:exonuclease domain-containing protein [Photobacterium sanguinicancri]MDO6544567.1 exonuclease domain-containing protein [Photobacterium sanguinicancri]